MPISSEALQANIAQVKVPWLRPPFFSATPSHLCLQQHCPVVESFGKDRVIAADRLLENADGSKVEWVRFLAFSLRGRVGTGPGKNGAPALQASTYSSSAGISKQGRAQQTPTPQNSFNTAKLATYPPADESFSRGRKRSNLHACCLPRGTSARATLCRRCRVAHLCLLQLREGVQVASKIRAVRPGIVFLEPNSSHHQGFGFFEALLCGAVSTGLKAGAIRVSPMYHMGPRTEQLAEALVARLLRTSSQCAMKNNGDAIFKHTCSSLFLASRSALISIFSPPSESVNYHERAVCSPVHVTPSPGC